MHVAMSPCSPDKNEDSQDCQFFYITDDSNASNCSENLEDAKVQAKMDNLLSDFPQIEDIFDVTGLIGEGTFSTVFLGRLKNPKDKENDKFAIKHIIPTSHPSRVMFELQCLKSIGGSNNVAGVNFCLRNKSSIVFIMPFQYHQEFCDYVGEMDAEETALYIKNLLIALAHVHKYNVIHRDVKPNNFLYNRLNKTFLLVDFGLAHLESTPSSISGSISTANKRKRTSNSSLVSCNDQKENKPSSHKSPAIELQKDRKTVANRRDDSCKCYGRPQVCTKCTTRPAMQASRAGTPGFRPPEVLLKSTHQTTAVDIWAAGVILLQILSNSTQFFSCPNDFAALAELVTLFGYANMKKVAEQCGRFFITDKHKSPLDLRKVCCTLRNRGSNIKPLLSGEKCENCDQYKTVCFCLNTPLAAEIEDKFPASAYDLLYKLLDINPSTRISAEDALQHSFIKNV